MADALSMKEEEIEVSLCFISILQFDWVKKARIEWKQHQEVCKIIQQQQEEPISSYNFV